VGCITQADLDKERMVEINSIDMLQNMSIVNNPEVITEMQILCIFAVYFIMEWWKPKKNYNKLIDNHYSEILMIIFASEHLLSYFFSIYRNKEIEN